MAPHSSTLVWEIPWMEEPGRLQSMGSLRVGHNWATSLSLFTFMHWRRKWQPTPVFLPGQPQGWGSLVGCHLWGRTESNMTETTWYLAHAISHRKGANVGQLAPTWMNVTSMRKPSRKNPRRIMPCMKWSEVAQLCPTLCDPMDCSLPGSSVRGIFQARILEWVEIGRASCRERV